MDEKTIKAIMKVLYGVLRVELLLQNDWSIVIKTVKRKMLKK